MTLLTRRQRQPSSDAPANTSDESTPTSTDNESAADGSSTETPSPTTQPHDSNADPWAPENLVPLSVLALELDSTVKAVANKLGTDDIILDDIGMRCCTRTAAHMLITERNTRETEQRRQQAEARQRLAADSTAADTRKRVLAMAQAQRANPYANSDERFGSTR